MDPTKNDSNHSIRIQIEVKPPYPVVFNFRHLLNNQLKRQEEGISEEQTSTDDFYKDMIKRASQYNVEAEDESGSDEDNVTSGTKKPDDYDFEDPFIDDSEMLMEQPGSPVEPAFHGFFVYNGPLDGSGPIEKKKGKTVSKPKEKTVSVPKKDKIRKKTVEEEVKKTSPVPILSAVVPKVKKMPNKVEVMKTPVKKVIDSKKRKRTEKEEVKKVEDKKKKIAESVELKPLDPDVQMLIDKIRKDATLENFENKAKFPPNLKPTVLEAGLVTMRKSKTIDDNLVYHLMSILPYNRFTLKKFLTTKAGQLRVDELQQEIDELAILLKQTIDKMMPEQQRLFNEKIASTPNEIEKSEEEDSRPTPKFKCNDEVRKILYDIIQTEEQSIYISNQIAVLREFPDRPEVVLNESKARKSMYQRLLSCWPEGWMNTYEMSRQYSQYKAKVVSSVNSNIVIGKKTVTADVKKRKKAHPSGEDKDDTPKPTYPVVIDIPDSDSEDTTKPWQPSGSMKIESLISGKYTSS